MEPVKGMGRMSSFSQEETNDDQGGAGQEEWGDWFVEEDDGQADGDNSTGITNGGGHWWSEGFEAKVLKWIRGNWGTDGKIANCNQADWLDIRHPAGILPVFP